MNIKDIFKDEEKPVGDVVAETETPKEEVPADVVTPEEEPKEEPKVETKMDLDAIADKLANRIAKEINEKTTASVKDSKEVGNEFVNKFLAKGDKASRGDYPAGLSNLTKNQKIVLWFKSLFEKDHNPEAAKVFKALVEGTASQGGYLVPEEFRAEVWRCLPDMGVMRRLATIFPMRTDTMHVPTMIARPAAYWTAEYASKSTTSAEFGEITLTPYDLVCLLPVTEQLVADAQIDIVRFITQIFAETIARTEDKAFFTGSGTAQPTGIRSCSGTATTAAGGLLNFDDLLSAYYKVPQRHRAVAGSAWVANRKVIEILHKVKDTNGRYIFLPAGMSDVRQKPVDTIFGEPLYEQNDLPEDEVWYGDWSFYAIGDRQSLAVTTTREGGDAWRRNAIEIKAVERVDGECILGCAFSKVTGVQS